MGSPSTSTVKLLTKEEREKYEDQPTYHYVSSSSPASAFKPITVLRAKGAPNQILVPGRYSKFNDQGLLYEPLNEEEQRTVTQQLGPNKIVRFL